MRRELKLNGGEITVLKALGLSGTPMAGPKLLDATKDMATAELLDTLGGLIDLGYILSNKVNVSKEEDVERAHFRVNPSDSRDLREAINPSRRRDDERTRRRRRG